MPVVTCGPNCRPGGYAACTDPIIEYEGRVLATYERNGYNDSDFYAVVLTPDGVLKHVEYGTTRSWTYHNHATVDASDEVRADALAAFTAALVPLVKGDDADRVARISRGDVVASATKRGKNVGVTGVVKWIGPDRYARTYGGLPAPNRVGIKVEGEDRLRFLPEASVTLVSTERKPMTEAEVLATAEHWARSNQATYRVM